MNSDSYNLGKESLDFLFKTLKIDKEWSARNETSFDWWAHKLKQKIWFNSDIEDEGLFLTKICAETDLIINVDIESATQILEIIQPLGLLAAPIYDENDKSIKLYSHIYVHKESVGWLQELFTYVAIIQCTLAHNLINILNDRFHNNITIDESSHPDNGKRNAGDDMLNIISHIIIPAGENESPWSDTLEFGEISKMCNNFGLFSAGEMENRSGVTVEFPFDQQITTMLQVNGKFNHDQLGSGATLNYNLPFNYSKNETIKLSNYLNYLEKFSFTKSHLIGTWSAGQSHITGPVYSLFVPSKVYIKGLMTNLVMNVAMKSVWIRGMFGDEQNAISPIDAAAKAILNLMKPKRENFN